MLMARLRLLHAIRHGETEVQGGETYRISDKMCLYARGKSKIAISTTVWSGHHSFSRHVSDRWRISSARTVPVPTPSQCTCNRRIGESPRVHRIDGFMLASSYPAFPHGYSTMPTISRVGIWVNRNTPDDPASRTLHPITPSLSPQFLTR